MPDAAPLEAEKLASKVNVGQPASGTYGEKVDLARLQSSLPQSNAPTPVPGGGPTPSSEPVRPTPPQREGRPPSGAALPPGVPSPVLAPTDQPNVPVSTPLAPDVMQPAASVTSEQRRLQILDALADDPNVSKETREWAAGLRRLLLGA